MPKRMCNNQARSCQYQCIYKFCKNLSIYSQDIERKQSKNLSIYSQDIERKQNYDGQTECQKTQILYSAPPFSKWGYNKIAK